MKIIFLSVGKQHDPSIKYAIEAYTSRIARYFDVTWKLLPQSGHSGVKISEKVIQIEEARYIMAEIEESDYVITLDENGKELSTVELSEFLEKRMIAGEKRLVFIIGGAYGLDQTVLERADLKWSLSKLTFPHQLVRLILSETIYRSFSLLKGEPYHHSSQ